MKLENFAVAEVLTCRKFSDVEHQRFGFSELFNKCVPKSIILFSQTLIERHQIAYSLYVAIVIADFMNFHNGSSLIRYVLPSK